MTRTPTLPVPLCSEIEALVEDIPGWSPIDQLYTLSTLVYTTAHLAGDIVEVGSWCGRSAVALGLAARDTHGAVHCIDLFPSRDDWRQQADGSYSFSVEVNGVPRVGYEQTRVWAEPFERQLKPLYDECPSILERFQRNIGARGLQHIVHAHRGTSETFVAGLRPDFRCRLIFIDGDHSYRAVLNDIERLAPYLLPGGWICFDDAFSNYTGVDQAIAERVLDNPAYDIKRQMTRKCFVARRALIEIR
jgi:predicted O-methyltransferase YrrM